MGRGGIEKLLILRNMVVKGPWPNEAEGRGCVSRASLIGSLEFGQ